MSAYCWAKKKQKKGEPDQKKETNYHGHHFSNALICIFSEMLIIYLNISFNFHELILYLVFFYRYLCFYLEVACKAGFCTQYLKSIPLLLRDKYPRELTILSSLQNHRGRETRLM